MAELGIFGNKPIKISNRNNKTIGHLLKPEHHGFQTCIIIVPDLPIHY